MRLFQREGGEYTLVIMHARVAQKSYGTEKRSAVKSISVKFITKHYQSLCNYNI